MNKVAIIQARMTSSRLPGKVLMNLIDRPMLSHQIERIKRCNYIDDIVIATTTNLSDEPLIKLANKLNVRYFRGSEHDVLSRYAGAAEEACADLIVRVTSDCPLVDPEIIDLTVKCISDNRNKFDYVSNVIKRTYPRGLDVEAFFSDVLKRANRMAGSSQAREHVTHFIYGERPDLFVLGDIEDEQDNSDLRWTVDVIEDFMMIEKIYSELKLSVDICPYKEVIKYVRANPKINLLNSHIEQKKY